MAVKKWKKLERLYPIILKIIKKSKRHLTTNEIIDILNNKYNIKIHWKTCNNYLKELERLKHIKYIEIRRDKNIIHNWTLKGVVNDTGESTS